MPYVSQFSLRTKNRRITLGLLALASLLLQACAAPRVDVLPVYTPESLPVVYYAEFGNQPIPLTVDDIFALSSEQEYKFQRYMNNPSHANELTHKRVSSYLQKIIAGFNYHSDTFTASQAAENLEGNCLSLAILTTALARAANVEVGYELMRTPPVYQKKGNTIISSQHVRSILYQKKISDTEGYLFTWSPVIKIDYFPTSRSIVDRKVSEDEFVSMYFRNKAAEALVEERYIDAYWLTLEALEYAPNNAHATNMLALTYHNLGYNKDAEQVYQFGIKHAHEKLELLSNYHKFLVKSQRFDEAEEVHAQIAEMDEPNPFDWLELADESLENGQIADAIKYYDKVIDLAPYLHHGYFGLGRAEFMRGNTNRAKKHFIKAEEMALEQDTKAMYQAKLLALNSYANN